MLLGGYLIRIWERFESQNLSRDMDNFYNCVWYALITMSTVGYGDFSASSPIGRIIASLVAILGVFINSTLTIIMAENFNFKWGELKAYNMLNQIDMNEKFDFVNKMFLNNFLRIYSNKLKKIRTKNNQKLLDKLNNLENNLLSQRTTLLKQINEIKDIIRTSFKTNPLDIVVDKLVDVRKSAKLIKDTIGKFESLIQTNKENNRNLDAVKSIINLNE